MPPHDPDAGASARGRPRTLRLTLAYAGEEVRPAAARVVAMIAPGGSVAPAREGQAGFWIEVHDTAGQLVFQRTLVNPMPQDVESFDPRGGITRHARPLARGTFEVLLPDLPEAATFTLWGSVTAPGAQPPAARPLVRTSFDALRQLPADVPGERK